MIGTAIEISNSKLMTATYATVATSLRRLSGEAFFWQIVLYLAIANDEDSNSSVRSDLQTFTN